MTGIACRITGLRRQKVLRFLSFATVEENDGADDSGYGHEFRVFSRGSKFTKYLISVFEALEKRDGVVLQPLPKRGDQRIARGHVPPKFRVRRTS